MASRKVAIKEVSDSIFHLEFPTIHLMCSALIRFQEYYECPKFKNKIFTLEEYMDWYAEKFGDFTYFQDVAGFNIPSYSLNEFYGGDFDPLTNKEKKILQVFEKTKKPYYIIATSSASATQENDLIHEMSHGLYYINEEYHNRVKEILKGQDLGDIYKWLGKKGYNKVHFLDEAHALLMEDSRSFSRSNFRASDYRSVRRLLRNNYDSHYVPLRSKTKKVKI